MVHKVLGMDETDESGMARSVEPHTDCATSQSDGDE
jgi:hypothetical protein